jgi:hypothetical protein
MGEIDKNFKKNIQKDSQYFGINEIISLLKNDTFTDDNDDSNEESKEKHQYLKLKKGG